MAVEPTELHLRRKLISSRVRERDRLHDPRREVGGQPVQECAIAVLDHSSGQHALSVELVVSRDLSGLAVGAGRKQETDASASCVARGT